MMATWMLYAVTVGGLVTVAAMAVDRMAAARRRPARFVWLAAIVASVLWPIGHAVMQALPGRNDVALMPFTITLQPVVSAGVSGPDRAALVDRGLLAVWIALSLLFVIRLAHGVMSLRRTQRAWKTGNVDGMRVRLSDNVGPAVVGLRSMDVVLPEWIMTLDPHLRAIVLRHEEEHRVARDPYLLCAAGVAAALMPWNPALWLQARHLRLAVEMDCDGRVLRAHPSAERYGMLMLAIAQRRSTSPAMFAPMLSEPATQLERRILAMRNTTRRLTRITLFGGLAVAAGALFVACALESGSPTSPLPKAALTRMSADQVYFDFQVEQPVAPYPGNSAPRYPAILREAEIEGGVLAQFVVDTLGHADMKTFKILKSNHDLFTAAVTGSLPNMRFHPAEVGGRKVRQMVQMPFQFFTKGTTSAATKSPPVSPAAGNPKDFGVVVVTGARVVGTAAATRKTTADTTPAKQDRVEVQVPNPPTGDAAAAPQKYVEFQLKKPAVMLTTSPSPRFPDELRSANVEGQVIAQFVVDENGVPVATSFKVLKSTHELFTAAVREALPTIRFSPAEVDGRQVKQLMTVPFNFTLTK